MFYCDACRENAWHLEIWLKDGDGEVRQIPYKCRSWRHEGECRLWRGAQDFVRIREAMENYDHWSHVVLTFRQRGVELSGQTWRDCKTCWAKLRKRIVRQYGRFLYIQTWERHKSGWPHVHMSIRNDTLFNWPKDDPDIMFAEALACPAMACGFGVRGWLEPIRNSAAFSGYLCKLAKELTGAGKAYQIPINAPKNFRRIRASKGLLPPPHKDPNITGVLLFCKEDKCA